MNLDEKGRCCGRRPLRYKIDRGPCYPSGWFCPRCDRAYSVAGAQIENWAWGHGDGGWAQRQPAPDPMTIEKRQ